MNPQTQQSLRRVLNVIGADVTGGELAVPHVFRQFDHAGQLAHPELRSRLTDLLSELTGRLVAEPTRRDPIPAYAINTP
jgi:hypothetical protein